jgi:probable HAF family extracellular repeat protein
MALRAHTSLGRPLRLSVAALVAAALMAPAAGVSATSSSPSLQSPCTQANCVFVLDKGRFKTILFPFPADPQDSLVGINNRGQIAGGYVENDAEGFHGYFRDKRGRFTTIDVSGADGTLSYDLNDRGRIVGIYSETNPRPPDADDRRGFLRDESGRFTRLRVPGSVNTQAFGVNNRGQVVGEYLDADGRFHGFLWDKGRFTTIDVPNAATTTATDINDRGQISGAFFDDPTGATGLHGFLLSEEVYTTFDAPAPRPPSPLASTTAGRS